MKFVALFLLTLAFSITGCESPKPEKKPATPVIQEFKFTRQIEVTPGQSYYKEFTVKESAKVRFRLKANEVENREFDFSVLDRVSYNQYRKTKNKADVIHLFDMYDRTEMDTVFTLSQGEYLFGFENHFSDVPLEFDIEIFYGYVTSPLD